MSNKTKRFKEKTKEILTSHHRMAEVMRFEDYATKFDKTCYHLLEANRQTVVLPAGFFGEQQVKPQLCSLPDMYWVKLTDSYIIGGSDVVLTSNHKILYDMLAQCDEYNANMTDKGLLLLFGRPRHISDRYFYCYKHKNRGCIEKGINLVSNMSNNYFHFMFQIASKMSYISKMEIEEDIPLLVDERVLCVPQMKQIMDCLNEDHRQLIPMKANVLYNVYQLFCIGNPNIIIPNSNSKFQTEEQNNAFVYDTKALDFIKTQILSKVVKNDVIQAFPKRIFLSRKQCNKRQINEDELRPILEKYGFKFVYPETMNVIEQAKMFNEAEHIIGASGAAFTNLVFCSRGCQVLIFLSCRHNSTCFSSLGIISGASMMFIAGSTRFTELHTPYFRVAPEELDHYLLSIYSNQNNN